MLLEQQLDRCVICAGQMPVKRRQCRLWVSFQVMLPPERCYIAEIPCSWAGRISRRCQCFCLCGWLSRLGISSELVPLPIWRGLCLLKRHKVFKGHVCELFM